MAKSNNPPKNENVQSSEVIANQDNQQDFDIKPQPRNTPEKVLFSWKAPARPFKRRDREFWVTAVAIAFIVGLILLIVEGFMPVLLVISLVFLFYVMNTVEPDIIDYEITNKGVKVAGKTTSWDLFTRFWFSRRFHSDLIIFEMIVLPGRMELVSEGIDKKALEEIISEYIPHEEVPPSNLDKLANRLSKNLPGN